MRAKIKKKFDELEIAREKLFLEINEYSNDQLNIQPNPDKWSANQIIFHITSAEKWTLSYIKYKIEKSDKFLKMNINQYFKSALLKLALKGPIKWKAPKEVSIIPTDLNFEFLKADFIANRESWKSFLEEVPEDLLDKAIFRHPISGKMNLNKTLEFLKDHSERHFGQIRRIINKD
jgi:uncharacterized damage-inducible protein DinB